VTVFGRNRILHPVNLIQIYDILKRKTDLRHQTIFESKQNEAFWSDSLYTPTFVKVSTIFNEVSVRESVYPYLCILICVSLSVYPYLCILICVSLSVYPYLCILICVSLFNFSNLLITLGLNFSYSE